MRSGVKLALLVVLNAGIAREYSVPVLGASTTSDSRSEAQAFGRVTGLVFDSLVMRPLAGATVWIPGTTHSALSDARGRFALDSVATGRQQIAFAAAGLDSVGFGDLTVNAEVVAGKTTEVTLTSPSRARLWSMLCETRTKLSTDSGIVFGSVIDGETNRRLVQAPVTFSWFDWFDLTKFQNNLPVSEGAGNVRSDSTGVYYACGLPTGVQLTTEAFGNHARSGEVQYQIGERRLLRLDLVASAEMVSGNTSRGTAVVSGIVLNERRTPVADALVFLSGSDTTVRTDANGSFAIRGVPSGTLELRVRKVGLANTSRILNVRRGEDVQTSVLMTGATTLSTVNVGAERPKSPEMKALEERQKMGFGMAFDFTKDEPFTSLTPLMTVPRVKITYPTRGGAPTITMTVDGGQRKCVADVYLDGRRTDVETVSAYPPSLLAAMEVYNSPYQVPAAYMRNPVEKEKDAAWSGPIRNPANYGVPFNSKASTSGACGVVLYWTKAVLRP